MKKFLSILAFAFIFTFIFSGITLAQNEDAGTADNNLQKFPVAVATITQPSSGGKIYARTPVEIAFAGIPMDLYNQNKIYACFRTNMCIRDVQAIEGLRNNPSQVQDLMLGKVGLPSVHFDTGAIQRNPLLNSDIASVGGGGTATFRVCGDGDSGLKTECGGGDYFHPGHYYAITLYTQLGGNYYLLGNSSFYVYHTEVESFTATVEPGPTLEDIDPEDLDDAPPSTKHLIKVTLRAPIMPGGNSSNNYQIVVEGNDFQEEQCVTIGNPPGTNEKIVSFPSPDKIEDGFHLRPGNYLIKLNEQVDEKWWNNCGGGHTFRHLRCNLVENKETGAGEFNPAACETVVDPNNPENDLYDLADSPCRPLNNGEVQTVQGYQNLTRCTSFRTAIGDIGTRPTTFLTSIFSTILYIAGLGAVGIILYSGYRLMTSRGNKEVIQSERERLTAAIFGIIFIVLSFVILQIIGAQILRIPGFS